jgi:tetratricopeptide (TPR) repeat protein
MRRASNAPAVLLAAFLGVAVAGAFPLARPAGAAGENPTARPQIGQPVQAAEQLLKQKKYREALEKLRAADAVPDKTAYERYIIEGTRAAIDLNSGDGAAAIKALEAVLATGILSPQDALTRLQALAQLNYRIKDYAQVIADAARYYKAGGTDPALRLLVAQAYYLQSDFANAAKTLRVVLAAEEKAGKRPDENLLLMLLNSDFRQKDEADRVAVLKLLVATYPKKEYWTDLLTATAKAPGFSSRLTLDLDRLKAATGVLATADDFMEAAQLALLAGLPGDAKALLDKGFAAGVLGRGSGVDRQKRLAEMTNRQASEDSKSLGTMVPEADASGNGLAWEKLGEAYASYEQYDKAIAAYQRGTAKGGLKYPEDASLHLGIAYLMAGQKPKAKETLAAVGGSDGTRDLAQLWLLEAGMP